MKKQLRDELRIHIRTLCIWMNRDPKDPYPRNSLLEILMSIDEEYLIDLREVINKYKDRLD